MADRRKRAATPDQTEPTAERPPQDISSPIPRRSPEQQRELTQHLLTLSSFGQRLTHLFDHESDYYLLNGEPVIDRDRIEHLQRSGATVQHFVAKVPFVADWVRARTGQSLVPQALYNFKDGSRQNTRPAITNALAEFWRIHHLLLDPTVPASYFQAPEDDTERRTLELMTEIGLVGVNARDLKDSLSGSPDLDRRDLLTILDRIARHQRGQHLPDEEH